ncbi:M23 family metallopeptidase [bacterium]|nr:M23 family metallopeptidase [bacterium]
MAINNRRRFFSLIFVPDQERNPRSISLSYSTGKTLLAVLAVLVLHLLVGIYAYVSVFSLRAERKMLRQQNSELSMQNRKIERIAELHLDYKAKVNRILKAYGVSLGVIDDDRESDDIGVDISRRRDDIVLNESVPEAPFEPDTRVQNRLPYLLTGESDFYNPENVPTLLPVNGFLTTRFQSGSWYYSRRHLGIDIAADTGTPIRAAGSGIVIFADWTPDFGNLVILSHGNGYFTYYGHASRIEVTAGQDVKRGDIIALLGSSGISSAPHLHFEVWRHGKAINPEDILYVKQQASKTD